MRATQYNNRSLIRRCIRPLPVLAQFFDSKASPAPIMRRVTSICRASAATHCTLRSATSLPRTRALRAQIVAPLNFDLRRLAPYRYSAHSLLRS
eukprot:6050130-Pyramimonas_sp.AAC.1